MTGHSPGPHRSSAPTKWWACLVAVAALVLGVLAPVSEASAAPTTGTATSGASSDIKPMTLDGFDPGNLISDAVFTDKNTMTEAQIQAFFNGKVSRCLGGTDEDGRPIVCLKDFTITSASRPADTYCNGYTGAPNESAARIIYRVAQSCGINPQVLIVMLQKEQSLVTHTWPSAWRFDIALGQGCPDDAACNPAYVGFFYQIYGAARQMKIYLEGRYFTYYAPGKTWNILYHPVAARNCGSAPVYVANKATSALYYYTPYQPNAAALRAGYGDGDYCSSYGNRNFYNYFTDWFGSTQGSANNPFGNIELVQAQPGKFQVSGWAIDPNTADPIAVHVYVASSGTAITANIPRADVGGAYPAFGNNHGFSATVPAIGSGVVSVCIYAINTGAGANVLLGCRDVESKSGLPVGAMMAKPAENGIRVSGWAIDPDTVDPATVHVYVDNVGVAVAAGKASVDVPSSFSEYGASHGFDTNLSATPGTHTVCVYGINVGPGVNSSLGCSTVQVTGTVITEKGRAPVGVFESVSVSGNVASVSGWALDPDTASSIKVHLYVGSSGTEYTADKARADVGAANPGYGDRHGFAESLTLPVGTSSICAYAINTGPGGHSLLGCKNATVTSPVITEKGRAPVGVFESVSVSGNVASVSGWALDPDTASSIKVHLYVGSSGTEYTADKARADVGAANPGYGDRHGFAESLTLPVGTSSICAYAINTGPGGHSLLGCKNATVPPPAADPGRVPFGNFEAAVGTPGTITVSGWAIDPDTADAISVHVYVGAVGLAYWANKERADVGAAYPAFGPRHGFVQQITVSPGTYPVCTYAINNGAGGHTLLGCKSVVVG